MLKGHAICPTESKIQKRRDEARKVAEQIKKDVGAATAVLKLEKVEKEEPLDVEQNEEEENEEELTTQRYYDNLSREYPEVIEMLKTLAKQKK